MKLLLDTHVWLWYLEGSSRISKKHLAMIDDKKNEIYLSPVSVWEALILAEKGRIIFDQNVPDWIQSVLDKNIFREAPLTHAVAMASRQIKLPHEDPADRFLAATCQVYDFKFLTEDRHLKRLKALAV